MKRSINGFVVLLGLASLPVLGWNNFYVQDPRGWESGQGTIEQAIVSVQPRGLYTEYGLYLTLSARGQYFYYADTLEANLYFDLPEKAIVHDSWLWIGDEIVQAEIMDQWTASQIYEDIVKRRRDPSILFKQSGGQYLLRIYPMPKNEIRKVKITYLVPAQWTSGSVFSALPTDLLRISANPISTFYVLTWLASEWKNPRILEFPEIPFRNQNDPKFGQYLRADIPNESIQGKLNFVCDAPFHDGIYLNRYPNGENIYQLAFLPSKALNLAQSPKKVAVLLDYTASNSTVLANALVQDVRSCMHTYLASTDSFNLICSRLNILRVNDTWLPADSMTIEHAFQELGENPMANYSNLPSLLANGIDFVKTNGNDGNLMLLSNSDQVGDYHVANQLIDDLLRLMDPDLPIHIGSFQDQNYSYHYIGGRYYYGNEYFYSNISRLTSGNYIDTYSGVQYTDMLSSLFQSMGGFLNSFDLHTQLNQGFCFGRYPVNSLEQSIYLNRPILEIGKYNGSFPFVIEAAGVFESQPFSQTFVIPESETHETDSLAEEIWAGNYIQNLESGQQSNDIVGEIIDRSVGERVLSLYTAFLCLEPSMGGKFMSNPWDESSLVSAVENAQIETTSDTLFQAYPNPFNDRTLVAIKLKEAIKPNTASFKILNVLGQTVRIFEPSAVEGGNTFDIPWDGRNDSGQDVSGGVYFFVMQTPVTKSTLKLVYLK